MKNSTTLLYFLVLCFALLRPVKASAQDPVVQEAVYSDVSIPLRDMKPYITHSWEKWMTEAEREIPNKFRPVSPVIVADKAVQTLYNQGSKAVAATPLMNFEGLNNDNNTGRRTPPDPAGDVGPNHYVQAVNCMLQMYTKTGTSVYGPYPTSTLWNGFNGNWTGHNDGDAIVLYDENADRWIISQFAIDCPGTPKTEYQLVAVSTSPDPTGSYYRYAFQFDYMPDYGKLGVWNDGYYMAINRFNTNITGTPFIGAGACVMERSKMLTGDPAAKMVYFKTEMLEGTGSQAGDNCYSMLPSDCDGTPAAAGTPNYFVFEDWYYPYRLIIWALHADWNTPVSSTFTYTTDLPVAAYTELGSVAQPGANIALDGLGDRLMFRNQYRNFGSYETFVTCRSVNAGSGIAGIRWYEYRKTGSAFSIYQQSTYAPGDGLSRWMGSIAMNAAGDIGLAYSVASSSMYPSIRFTGRKAGDPLNQLTITEGNIMAGSAAMTDYTRWGDYTAMSIDPSDNTTFWTTQEYVGTYGGWCPWATRVASFKISSSPGTESLAATAITSTAATLNATVNPNSLATSYHFEWGTNITYGNTTTLASAGSGGSAVSVNAAISGLSTGTTYHFRITATNSEGTTTGNDLTFTPGAAVVSTSSVSSVTSTSASAGGNITTDGGVAVTTRGVCWGFSSNPVAGGSHTTDGTGTGTYTSQVTGLLSNTVYHLRAYAINATGTYYGDDFTFSTLCGAVTTFPWNEGFENSGAIPACWSQQQEASSGINWTFVAGNGASNPAAAYSGSYNALLKDATTADNKTMLITPPFDLTFIESPTLKFWHHQQLWSPDQDQLIVYYKTSAAAAWTTLASYTSSVSTWTEQTISLPNSSTEYYIAFEGNAKYGYGVCIDDVSITGTYIPTWAGTAGSDWNTAGNWTNNEVPATSGNIIIPSGGISNFPVITGATVQCANLNILAGANIHINPGGSLTVAGTLTNNAGTAGIVVKSDATGTGSLLHATANVPGTIERYITGSSDLNIQKYHLVSVPLATENASTSNLFLGSYLFDFSETANNWVAYGSATGTNLDEAKGFMIYYPAAATTYTLAGNLNSGNFSPLLTGINSPGNTRGWNLVPNPYPSAIDWDLVSSRTAVDDAIYIWPAAGPGNSSNYYSYVGGVSSPATVMNGEIAVGQSFFVHANTASPALIFSNASRLHGSKPFLKNDSIIPNVLYLEATTAGSNDYLAVRFAWPATPGFDTGLDAYKLTGGADAPQLSSVAVDGTRLSINSLPLNSANVYVPLNLTLNNSASVTIRASGMESFINDIPVYLEDRMLSRLINLRHQPEYTFAHSPTNAPDRFRLKFEGPYGVNLPTTQPDNKVFVSDGFLIIDIPSMNGLTVNLTVTDALGRQFSSSKMLVNSPLRLPAPLAKGLYIVSCVSSKQNFISKVVIE